MERMFHVKHQAYALRNERFARSPAFYSWDEAFMRNEKFMSRKKQMQKQMQKGKGALRIGFAGGLFQRLFPVDFSSAGLGSPVTVGFGWGKSGNRGAALKFCGYPRTMGAIEQVVYYWPKCSKACNSPVRTAGIG